MLYSCLLACMLALFLPFLRLSWWWSYIHNRIPAFFFFLFLGDGGFREQMIPSPPLTHSLTHSCCRALCRRLLVLRQYPVAEPHRSVARTRGGCARHDGVRWDEPDDRARAVNRGRRRVAEFCVGCAWCVWDRVGQGPRRGAVC